MVNDTGGPGFRRPRPLNCQTVPLAGTGAERQG